MIQPPVEERHVTCTTTTRRERKPPAEDVDEREWVLVPPTVAAQYWTWIISQAFPAPGAVPREG